MYSDEAAGADPGIFVGGGGGFNYPEIYDSKKNKTKQKQRV